MFYSVFRHLHSSEAFMVTLPPQFVATRVPGYFYNTETGTVYSIKSGILKEMARKSYWSRYYGKQIEGYQVSHCGVRNFLPDDYLQRLKVGADSEIRVDRSRRS